MIMPLTVYIEARLAALDRCDKELLGFGKGFWPAPAGWEKEFILAAAVKDIGR